MQTCVTKRQKARIQERKKADVPTVMTALIPQLLTLNLTMNSSFFKSSWDVRNP
jgi:hypothetical protein